MHAITYKKTCLIISLGRVPKFHEEGLMFECGCVKKFSGVQKYSNGDDTTEHELGTQTQL